VTVTVTNSTPSAIAVVIAQQTPTTMTSATMWTTASERWTPVVFATDQVPFSNVVAQQSLLGIATVTGTKKTPSAFAEEPAPQMQTATAFVTMSMRASEHWTPVAYAMALAPSTIADVPKSQPEIATATETN